MSCVEEVKIIDFKGKFVVPQKSEPEIGWYFALVVGNVIDGDKFCLFLWDRPIAKTIRKSIDELSNSFTVFDDEKSARECLVQRKSILGA